MTPDYKLPATMTPTLYRIALVGLGNVGSAVLSILHREQHSLLKRYGVTFCVIGVAELGGCAIDENGLDLGELLATLQAKQSIASLPSVGRPGMPGIELLTQLRPDIVLEATPVNLQDGQPGLSIVTAALQQGIHVVLANKGPLALAYRKLAALSDLSVGWGRVYHEKPSTPIAQTPYPKLRFSACVAGALPTINLGCRDLAGCGILRLEAVFNGTTQYILRAMEEGQSYEAALLDAQRRGIAETDPSLDVDGLDAAAKLVITANAVLGQAAQLSDVRVQGIRGLSQASVQQSLKNGQRMVLVCLAELIDGSYQLSVQPTALTLEHPLARLTPDEMGVVFYTQDVERLSCASSEPGAAPAAAAMLRDMLEIVRSDKQI
jgi:homoserine dehydrogenase